MILISACKKTTLLDVFDKKMSKTRLSKFLKSRSLLIVNDCFKNEINAVFGVFLSKTNYSEPVEFIVPAPSENEIREFLIDKALDI